MKPHITEAMVDARVAEQLEAQTRRGVSLPIGLVRGLARTHLEMTALSYPDPNISPRAPEPPKASPRPLPAPVAATSPPPRPVVPAAVIADRERAVALIAMTAKGTEAEAECRAAISAGTSPEAYRATVAARSILDAIKAVRQTRGA